MGVLGVVVGGRFSRGHGMGRYYMCDGHCGSCAVSCYGVEYGRNSERTGRWPEGRGRVNVMIRSPPGAMAGAFVPFLFAVLGALV